MLAVCGTVCLFHLLVITGIIPYTIVWGGKLQNQQEMLTMESVSILINAFMAFTILLHSGKLKSRIPKKWLTAVIWIFVALFSLNTIGNLFAEAKLETIIFTPLTLVSAILCSRIAIE